jgi:hypothetical protein
MAIVLMLSSMRTFGFKQAQRAAKLLTLLPHGTIVLPFSKEG